MPRVNITIQLRDGGESHGHQVNADGTVVRAFLTPSTGPRAGPPCVPFR